MANYTMIEEMIDQLRAAYAAQISTVMRELPAHMALQLADDLCRVQVETLAGLRIAYRPARKVDEEAVISSWRRGSAIPSLMREFDISRATVYRIIQPARATAREDVAASG